MIYEYAMDPECLGTFNSFWQALSQFGVHHGRVLCECPTKWLKDVKKAIYDATGDDDYECAMLIERLKELEDSDWFVRRASEKLDQSKDSWFEKILPEHQRMPFRGVICNGPKAANGELVLTKYDLRDENPNWYVDPTPQVARTAGDIARAFAPLGRRAADLLIIDPYFGQKPHDFLSIPAIISSSHCNESPLKRIEIHTVFEPGKPNSKSVTEIEKSITHALKVEFCNLLPKDLPQLSVTIWERSVAGDAFHDRYLLTNIGGVGITVGLDVGKQDERLNEDTTIFRLGPELFLLRKSQFDRHSVEHKRLAKKYKWVKDVVV